jgi:pimeloyl-ACP methyl ester carboxylesterase
VMSRDNSGTVTANGIEIAYETFGAPSGRPLLLVMGLGAPMVVWRPELCQLLADHGFFVIRFDNRDVGRSTHLRGAPMPNLMAALAGDVSGATYTLDDMAEDGFGLLDALGIPAAHVMGVSLGGMIVQTMAALHPDRVLSLTSISSTPAPMLSNPKPEAQQALMTPPPATREAAIARMLDLSRIVGSPAYETDEVWAQQLGGMMWDLGTDVAGVLRQTMAIYASGDRTEAVRRIKLPTLVIHGDSDPLINVSAGRFTAEIIEGAELLVIPGMGHDLPRQVWPTMVDAISAVASPRR